MADVTISYKNNEIATMNATGVKTLLTGDTFCEDDIVVAYTKPSTPAPTLQGKTVYPSASDQTTTPDQGYDGLSSVISKGVLLTNLTAGNIKKDVVVKVGDSADDDRIASIIGTYEGSGGGGVQTATVSVGGGTIYYTDANMTYQQVSGLLTAAVPIGTLVVTNGPGPFPIDPVGVTQILSRVQVAVYEVTG